MDKLFLRCDNDVVFKYLLLNQQELIFEIIKSTTGIESKSLTVKNPNILPDKEDEKNVSFDILVQNEQGYLFDIEMQNSTLSIPLVQRGQYYASRMIAQQAKIGSGYNLKPAYCIVLINRGTNYSKLIDSYVLRNNEGVLQGNLINVIFVYLPFINKISRQKGLKQLNTFERIIYALHNNLSYDILEIEDEVIHTMAENRKVFYSNEGDLLTLAEKMWWNAYIEQEKEKERIKAEQETMRAKQEKKQAEQEKKQAEQERQQAEQERQQAEQERQQAELELRKAESRLIQYSEEREQFTEKIELHIKNIMKKLDLSYEEAVAFLTSE